MSNRRRLLGYFQLVALVWATSLAPNVTFSDTPDCKPTRWEDEWRKTCGRQLELNPELVKAAEKKEGFLVVAPNGSQFLIPKKYLPTVRGHGPAREFGIEMRLPDFRTFISREESRGLLGHHDRIRANFHPENLYQAPGTGGLVTEWQMGNLVSATERQKKYRLSRNDLQFPADYSDYIRGLVSVDSDLNAEWEAFKNNRHPEERLIDVTHILGWLKASNRDPKFREIYFVAFRGGHLILKMDCNLPESRPSPGCNVTYHLPGRYLYLTYSFGYSYKGQDFFRDAIRFGDQIYALLDSFRDGALLLKRGIQDAN